MLNAETYITSNPGIGGTIRNFEKDFYVEEIPIAQPSGRGPNAWIWIEKERRTTLDVLMDISAILKISRKRMGFAGMKDKQAITRQWICVSNMDSFKQFNDLIAIKDNVKNTKFLKIIRNQKKLRLGQLQGNKFKILIRGIDNIEKATKIANETLKSLETTGVLNYFGWQRFGSGRVNTHLVGKALVHNDLEEAIKIYIGYPIESEPEEVQKARKAYDDGNLEKSFELMPKFLRFEREMLKVLIKENKKRVLDDSSYKKAIFSLPKPLQRMFVHAYQSGLFNKVISERAKLGVNNYVEGDILIDNEEHMVHEESNEKLKNMIENKLANPTAPLYGSKVPLADKKIGEMERRILEEEKIKLEDFKTPKTPKLGSHGLRRSIKFNIWDTKAIATKNGVLTEFSISKGSYATSVLREVMKKDVY
ncbi:tRNA pseudouridine(13) synthase TruD [Methanobrevibacter curvatus]|uniref:Probable tRNA pseudouridine synthase D n=1 Tax=Methanobrevibacter curvatus TaxID=49547 RepID=A0A162FGN0_9EURY|nr:tRNA pseudouridine(13) synthase TruD [Methanobrevibacter curvatus]KZX12765.1 tRNA pseudouridine synthase D [Methanobrevibacter curvatus]